MKFLIMLAVALVVRSIGFKKYVWFISIGYGFAVAAIGVALLAVFHGSLVAGTVIASLLFIIQTVQKLSGLYFCLMGKLIFQINCNHFFLSTTALSPRGDLLLLRGKSRQKRA